MVYCNKNHGNIFFWRTVSVDKAALCINMYEIIELGPWHAVKQDPDMLRYSPMPFHCRHRKGANQHRQKKEGKRTVPTEEWRETCTGTVL